MIGQLLFQILSHHTNTAQQFTTIDGSTAMFWTSGQMHILHDFIFIFFMRMGDTFSKERMLAVQQHHAQLSDKSH